MTIPQAIETKAASSRPARLFVLELGGDRILSMRPDGSESTVIVNGCRYPDGIAVDVAAGHIYWTNMGNPSLNDGSIERANFDGYERIMIVPPGGTYTPKQLQLDKAGGKLYWCDREGMRVMRANLDGSHVETLVETGFGELDRRDQTRWCVGIALDPERDEIYWTQKGPDNGDVGRLFRAPIAIRPDETAGARTDIKLILDRLPEPIDLELDQASRQLYWTDRGDPPRGNSVNRMSLDERDHHPGRPEIIFTHLMEGIGIALDVANDRMFLTDFAGSIYSARLDGSDRRTIAVARGNLTGIAYAEI